MLFMQPQQHAYIKQPVMMIPQQQQQQEQPKLMKMSMMHQQQPLQPQRIIMPAEMVTACSLNAFKARLDRHFGSRPQRLLKELAIKP